MKLAFDLLTIILFFCIYKMYGMYPAVASAMICYSLQTLVMLILKKPIDKMQWFTLGLIVFLGGLTLLFHNELFFKWKPTAVYWLFAVFFIGSHYIGNKKPLIQRLADQQIEFPDKLWVRLNQSWSIFFILMGILNVVVVYSFDTNTWVNFKLFGVLGLTLLFIVGQALYMAKHQVEKPKS